MAAEIVAGAALGTLFAELCNGFKEMKKETKRFREHLENLKCTLDSLKPLIFEEIIELNMKLDLPTSEIEDIKTKMKKGAELVRTVSQIRKREYLFVRRSYSNQLVELNRSLKVLLDTLKIQEAKEVKEILFNAKKLTAEQADIKELLKTMMEKLNVRQEPRDYKEALLCAVKSSKQLVELEASTRLLLAKPAVKRQARNVEETRELVASTEMALERVTENGRLIKGLESLVQRTAVGTIIHDLSDVLHKVKGKFSKLEFLQPLIGILEEKYNNVAIVDHAKEEPPENIITLVEDALKLLRSKLRTWISHKKYKYSNQLLAMLDRSLQKLLDILKVQELRNINETSTLAAVRNMETVVQRLLDV